MNEDTDPFPPTADEDALDRLLATASWPTADGDALRRLTRTVSDERRRRRVLHWALPTAVAAAVTIAGVCWIGLSASRDAHSSVPSIAVRPQIDLPLTKSTPLLRGTVGRASELASAGRSPTVMEQMLMINVSRGKPKKLEERERPDTPLVADGRPDDQADRVGVLRAAREALARRTSTGEESKKLALAAQLAAVATPADWPVVRAYLAMPSTQRSTLVALVERGDEAAVNLLLRGVLDPSLRPAVLAMMKTGAGLPSAALVAKFDAPGMDERWAAAVALGRGADADTLDRLARMAESGAHRREAIAALVASDTPAARALLIRLSKTREAAPHIAPAREAIAVLLTREGDRPCFPSCGS